MNRGRDPEAAAAESVLADFAGGSEDTAPGVAADEVAEVLRRLYVEGFGLLGYDVEPESPTADLRARLLAGLGSDETQEVEPVPTPRAAPAPIEAYFASEAPQAMESPAATQAPAAMQAPAAIQSPAAIESPARRGAPAAAGKPAPRERPAAAPVPRRSRWPAVLATLFALAAAGLGLGAAFLQSELDSSRARLRRVEAELAQAESNRKLEVAAARGALDELGRRYALVTAPAVVLYSLRPAPPALQPAARATLYVAPDRRRWQLEARGLRPETAAQDYQLWFVVDGVARRGGVFDAVAGQPSVVEGVAFPAGVTAVTITLERKGGTPLPTTPIVLAADGPVQL